METVAALQAVIVMGQGPAIPEDARALRDPQQ